MWDQYTFPKQDRSEKDQKSPGANLKDDAPQPMQIDVHTLTAPVALWPDDGM